MSNYFVAAEPQVDKKKKHRKEKKGERKGRTEGKEREFREERTPCII